METDSSLLQAVAVLILLGAAVPLIKPRLPLPAKNAVAGEKKADDDAVESEGEKAEAAKKPWAVGVYGGEQQVVPLLPPLPLTEKQVKLTAFSPPVAQGFAYFSSTLWLPSFGTSLGLSTTSSSALLASVNGTYLHFVHPAPSR
jgi:MCP family monocarboxylic acid transporter-like MFS transporter 10